jgi:hypothetical protein
MIGMSYNRIKESLGWRRLRGLNLIVRQHHITAISMSFALHRKLELINIPLLEEDD